MTEDDECLSFRDKNFVMSEEEDEAEKAPKKDESDEVSSA